MKQRMKQIGLVLFAGLLFPYMTVLLVMQRGMAAGQSEAEGTHFVILQDGTVMDGENYLAGILAKQISPDKPPEVLKAQAVLARTWLYQAMGEDRQIEEAQLKEYQWDSGWFKNTYGAEYLKVYKQVYLAIRQTKGETAWYRESRITPLYHALSAGETRADTSGLCPYLAGRACNFDMEAEGYQQIRILEKEQVRDLMNGIDPLRQLEDTDVDAEKIQWNTDTAGYVLTAQIGGSEFSGQELQEALSLQSPWIRMDTYGEQLRIISRGIGHGYGLSQWEAARLADSGYDYRKILEYFFYGIDIKTE